nr:cutinase family protein [Nocardia transvalensis]
MLTFRSMESTESRHYMRREFPSTTGQFRTSLAFGAAVAAAALASAAPVAPTASAAPACTDFDVVVARGTNEAGTLGAVVGGPVYRALQDTLHGSTSSYRVDYPASFNQPASVQAGNRDLVAHVTKRAAACPGQRFILVGYSQGANVVDNSAGISSDGAKVGGPIVATLPASVEPKVIALLLFGNPIRSIGREVTGTYAARTFDSCAVGDPVCERGGKNMMAHMSYGSEARAAAEFAAERSG